MPTAIVLFLVAAQVAIPAAATEVTGLPLVGVAAEEFLSSAEVIDLEYFDNTAATRPRRATLSDGTRAFLAVFKNVDSFDEKGNPTSGRSLHKLHDAYSHEIAAYELDKLLGMGIIPPCVERTLEGELGSLCLWVLGAHSAKGIDKNGSLDPPDQQSFADQSDDIRLFLQLARDVEYHTASNILIDGNWKLYKIDSSRSFGARSQLLSPGTLGRFRRSTVEALRSLSEDELRAAMAPWLDADEIKALWKRRGRIIALIQEKIDAEGEVAVLY